MTINNIHDLAKHLETSVDRLEHDVYKYTDCGAWIQWDSSGVEVGSIVEGSDAEFDRSFIFPFSSETYDAWIEELEMLCDQAWHEANDDEEECDEE